MMSLSPSFVLVHPSSQIIYFRCHKPAPECYTPPIFKMVTGWCSLVVTSHLFRRIIHESTIGPTRGGSSHES